MVWPLMNGDAGSFASVLLSSIMTSSLRSSSWSSLCFTRNESGEFRSPINDLPLLSLTG